MIYHNYSPYYYGTPTNSNRKFSNTPYSLAQYSNYNNHNAPVLYNNKRAPTFSPNSKANNQKPSEIIRNNHYKTNLTCPQPFEESKERTLKQKKTPPKSNDDVIFEIFGIKLYFDDILLICLIFFLYNEGVQDQYLFIALVLLLLS